MKAAEISFDAVIPQWNRLKLYSMTLTKNFSGILLFIVLFSCATIIAGELPKPETLRTEVETELERTLNLWYSDSLPNSLDGEHGGFHTRLGRDWKPLPYETKGIVHQSRMTWTAAEVGHRRAEWKEKMLPIVRHGTKFLREKMWDADFGGFYWEIKADGTLPDNGTNNVEMKHAYGISFAVYALATAYALTGDEDDLTVAVQAFSWLDKHGHDKQHGGYCEAFYRDGQRMTAPPEGRPDLKIGKVGERLGCKSMNTHIHLLESYTALYKVWPDERLRQRLEELLHIVRDRITTWPGAMRQFFRDDWAAAATYVSFGHDVETAFLMHEAIEALDQPDDAATLLTARSLVDHSLEFGWDSKYGGFYRDGATFGHPADTRKDWWVHAEGLNTLLLMHRNYGNENDRYYRCFVKQWEFIKKYVIDPEYGGWISLTDADGSNPQGFDKSHLWKSSYHECRALLNVADMLRKLTID